MDMKNISYYLLACLLLGSCSKIYEETDNGVIIKVQQKNDTDVQLVRLQVMGDKLVHVSATPESRFADPQSLVVIPQKEQTPPSSVLPYLHRPGRSGLQMKKGT